MGHLSALKFALFTLTLYFLSATERNAWGSQENFRQRRTVTFRCVKKASQINVFSTINIISFLD